jgi:GxxExxY protein
VVGVYIPDILVGSAIIVDVKAVKAIGDDELAQVLNYLKATGLRIGPVLNFAKPKLEIKRVVRNS